MAGRRTNKPPGRSVPRVDPITVSVLAHRLQSIVEEMGEAMLRTSYSQILNSSRDFSTALLDGGARLIAQAHHVPIHVGALPWAVMSVQDFFSSTGPAHLAHQAGPEQAGSFDPSTPIRIGVRTTPGRTSSRQAGSGRGRGRIRPGDVFLLNDPYHGGNHLPDLTALLPVFVGGELAFWSINRAHQSDIGGSTHGAYNPAATEIWQEGLRITPLKLYDAGVLRDDVLHMVATNVRHPHDFRGDLNAMIGSARVGERRLRSLLGEYGLPALRRAIDAILDGTERQAREVIRTWKDGVYYGESVLDADGHGNEDIAIRAKVTKKGGGLVVDLTDSDPQVTGFVNSSYPNMMSAVFMAVAYLIDPDTPKNSGLFRVVEVKAKQGTVVWPHPPAPVTLATNHCAQEIAESVIKALAPACPERVMAGWGRRFRIAIRGTDPRTGRQFIWHMFHARPGGGASAAGDGWNCVGEGQAAGGIKFGSIEVAESRFPLFFEHHEFRPDSAGEGQFRGGVGAVLRLRMETDAPAVANTAGDGVRHCSFGIRGGGEGLPHRYRLMSNGAERSLKTKEVGIKVQPGDVFLIESSGGGGYGDQSKRDPAAAAYDIENGYVTAKTTRSKKPAPGSPTARASRRR